MPPNKPLKLTAAGFSQSGRFSPTRIVVGIIGGRSLAAIR